MELLSNEHFYVLLHDDSTHGLLCNRIDGSFSAITRESASKLPNLSHMGIVYGIIGKYLGSHLVLIRHRNLVGTIFDPVLNSEHEVYVIKNVLVLPVLQQAFPDQTTVQLDLPTSPNTASSRASAYNPNIDKDDCSTSLPPDIAPSSASISNQKTSWNPIKVASALKPKMPNLNSLNSINMNYPSLSQYSITNNQTCSDELNKRLIEEMCKLFTDTNSFYYSYTIDLTNSFQRQYLLKKERYINDKQKHDGIDSLGRKATHLLWQDADDRFFWNQHMLQDLIDLAKNSSQDVNHWILPILHGFVQLEKYNISTLGITGSVNLQRKKENKSNENNTNDVDCDELIDQKLQDASQDTELSNYATKQTKRSDKCDMSSQPNHYQLGLISRRSKYRAGTRYKRRGCDEDGNCANFVETEQIFRFGRHFVSFLLIRGSIPLFWSQPGFKYRPAPVLARSPEENFESFSKHFKELFYYYGPNHILVDCTEQTGREKVVKDAYKATVDKYLEMVPKSLTYISFDFHRHCRGRRLLLVEQHLQENGLSGNMIKGMRYFWFDSHGLVCEQRGIFRINCIDCLDRTNIVQRAIALQVLDTQLIRLGLLPPEIGHESNHCRKVMQLMWANNGDILSRQYAGSNALKGDFTRTGERKFSGYLKDTYSSASRYYISKFRDAYRQAAIDAMLGIKDALLNNEILMSAAVTDAPNSSDPMLSSSVTDEKFEEINEDERINQMLEDCRKMIMTDEEEQVLGCWLLYDCDSSSNQLSEQELLVILTSDSYYLVDYDEATERVVNFQRVKLEQIEKVELGLSTSAPIFSMTGALTSHQPYPSLRIIYSIEDQNDFFHLLRSATTMAKSSDDDPKDVTKSPLKSVQDSFKAACDSKSMAGVQFLLIESRLTRRKSRLPGIVSLSSGSSGPHSLIDSSLSSANNKSTNSSRQWFLPTPSAIRLEPLLSNGVRGGVALRNVGSRTFDNVSNRLARLKGKLSISSRMQYEENNTNSEQNNGGSSRKMVNQRLKESNSQQTDNQSAMTCQKLSVFQRNFKCPSDTSLKHLESAIDSTIDWPSSGSVETLTSNNHAEQTRCGNNPLDHNDDPYEDDDYTDHAMLSIDFAEIQRLKEIDLSYPDNRGDYSLPPIDYYKVLPIPEYNNTSSNATVSKQEDNEMLSAQSDQVNSSSNLEMSQMISTLASAKTADDKEDKVMETLINEKKI